MLQWVCQFSQQVVTLTAYSISTISYFSTFRFSDSLGSGAFGEVFKGKWREQPIAAKKIRDPSFFVELQVSHLYGAAENILQLLAYSFNQIEGNISYLIYPYMEHGSVFRRLYYGRPRL